MFLIPALAIEAGDPSDEEWCETLSEESRTGGLVPCGRSCGDPTTSEDEAEPCQLCHFFVMIERWINGLLFKIIPALAALMIAIGGGMYILSRGDPEKLSQAKKLFASVALGMVIIYGAFLIIGAFLFIIGLATTPVDWNNFYQSWWKEGIFRIDCP